MGKPVRCRGVLPRMNAKWVRDSGASVGGFFQNPLSRHSSQVQNQWHTDRMGASVITDECLVPSHRVEWGSDPGCDLRANRAGFGETRRHFPAFRPVVLALSPLKDGMFGTGLPGNQSVVLPCHPWAYSFPDPAQSAFQNQRRTVRMRAFRNHRRIPHPIQSRRVGQDCEPPTLWRAWRIPNSKVTES